MNIDYIEQCTINRFILKDYVRLNASFDNILCYAADFIFPGDRCTTKYYASVSTI